MVEQFRTEGGPAVREYCPHLTKLDCCRRAAAPACALPKSDQEAKAVLLLEGAVTELSSASHATVRLVHLHQLEVGMAFADALVTIPL